MDIQKVLEEHDLWLKDELGIRADLRGADLCGTDLRGADLRGADLRGADLWGSNLFGSDLGEANLRGAGLHEANLKGVKLKGADLIGANLLGAKGVYQFGPMPTSGRFCYAVWHGEHWMVKAGCFWGTLDELEVKVKKAHNCPVYLANIELLRNWKYEA